MAYIGVKPTIGNFQICDAISVVNGQAAYTMQVGSVNVIPQSANHMIVSLNGVIQKPGSSFTVSGSTITFASNLATGDAIDFIQILGDVLDLGTPSDATVTAAKIGANAVTAAKLNNDIISGSTELASEPADTDEFLVSDAGTLKRIDYSLIKGITGLGHSSVYMTSDTAISGTSHIQPSEGMGIYNAGAAGTGIVTDTTDGNIQLDKTGFYLVIFQVTGNSTSSNDEWNPYIATYDGSSESNRGYGYVHVEHGSRPDSFTTTIHAIVDVSNTSSVKFRMKYAGASNITLYGTGQSVTSMTFIRLGDT
jgi:hypothetical protein